MNSPEKRALSRDPAQVREMFDRVAPRYDLANHILSLGCDFFWRKRAAEIVRHWDPCCILDLATGSGDLALALQRAVPRAEVLALDFSSEMVKLARRKGVQRTLQADAMDLPLAGQSFDAVTIGFGLRNLPDWPAALREMRRVLISNGHLLVLDFSLPDHVGLRWLYRAYLHRILPRLSRLITGYADAYEYLAASIENFPRAAAMCELIESNGFQNTVASHISGGIVSIYTAEKL